jgi:prepilin-type N-terminal cleavage/methylation domain-containing protein
MDHNCNSPAEDAGRPAPLQERPYVAVASLEGRFVNGHLGHADRLWIFGRCVEGYEFIETRPAPPRGGGVQRWRQLAEILSDCRALLAAAAGLSPVQALQAAGIEVAVVEGPVGPILDAVYRGGDLGVYHPTEDCGCGPGDEGFTLAELLTVLAVVAVLLATLVPSLNTARKAARALVCQSNLRSSGLALLAYGDSQDGFFPPAFAYIGSSSLYSQPQEPVLGIRHWSGLLLTGRYAVEDSLHCPEIPQGGLAPQNTEETNLDQGQAAGRGGVVDVQARRCAFTVNEALCPRNRFKTGFEGVQRPSRLVRLSQVGRQRNTILLTEWPADWRIVSGPDSTLSQSHLPVHGFRGLGEMAGADRYDLNMTVSDAARPCLSIGNYRRVNSNDLSNSPSGSRRYPPRLDWVGRNHRGPASRKNLKESDFFYLDGHTESKSVYSTIEETSFEWGDKIYSLAGQNHIN